MDSLSPTDIFLSLLFSRYGLIALIVILLSWIRQVNQYERGILLTMGKYRATGRPASSHTPEH